MNRPEPVTITSQSIRLFFVIFMVTGALISGVMMVFYRSEIKTQLSTLKTQETFSVELQSLAVEGIIESIAGDLFFISQQNELKEYLGNRTTHSLDKIATEYLAIAKQKKIYDQIRFIDRNGLEVVRVNYNQGVPSRVPKDKLQSKQNRYYFKDSYALEKDALFISPFDLNIEKGKIEQPLKPMIRLATPVFDSENQKQGIVIVNYLGNSLLNKINELESVSEGQTMLLNSDGYWLLSPTPGQAWGFMYKDEQRTFGHLYKKVWEEIRLKKNGQMETADGLFTFKTIYPLKKGAGHTASPPNASMRSDANSSHDTYSWHLLSFVPSQAISSYSNHLLTKLFAFGVVLFLIIASGSWNIAMSITKRRIYQTQLKVMALFDPLTGLPNRRLFFDRLSMTLEQSLRNKYMFALLYLDLDGFKKVNDSLGHGAGDELLCTVAGLLKNLIRKSDTIARLGGDEFAIIIDRLKSAKDAEIVAEKILSSLATSIQLEAGNVNVGASIGISLFPADSNEAEELVQMADKSMYTSKNKGKNTYTFFCNDTGS